MEIVEETIWCSSATKEYFMLAAWASKETPSSSLGLYQEIHGTHKIRDCEARYMTIGLLMGGRGKKSISTAIKVYNVYGSYRVGPYRYGRHISQILTMGILASGGNAKDVPLSLSLHSKIREILRNIGDIDLREDASISAAYLTAGMLMGNQDESFIPNIIIFYSDLKKVMIGDYSVHRLVAMAALASKKDKDEILAIAGLPLYSDIFKRLGEELSSFAIAAILLSDFTQGRQAIFRRGSAPQNTSIFSNASKRD